MNLRGLEKFTLVDYPGKIASIVFTGGCNLRCPFCHNPVLVFDPESQPRVTETEFFNYLAKRRGLIEGVVISGGEPLLQTDISQFIARIRAGGFAVKLDTNGTMPERLYEVITGCGVDALGIDYKLPAARYGELGGGEGLGGNVARSITMALASGAELDIRTTVHKRLLSPADLAAMAAELEALGVTVWTLQQYHAVEVIDDTLSSEPTYNDKELTELARKLRGALRVKVRGIYGRELD